MKTAHVSDTENPSTSWQATGFTSFHKGGKINMRDAHHTASGGRKRWRNGLFDSMGHGWGATRNQIESPLFSLLLFPPFFSPPLPFPLILSLSPPRVPMSLGYPAGSLARVDFYPGFGGYEAFLLLCPPIYTHTHTYICIYAYYPSTLS